MRWFGNLALAIGFWMFIAGAGLYWSGQQGQQQAGQEWESLQHEQQGPAPVLIADGAPLAKLSVPRLDRHHFVIKGASRANLKKGPAWLAVTSPPGTRGNCVIAGHRDTHFRFLKDVQAGDEIRLAYGDRVYRYRVESLSIVKPGNNQLLRPSPDAVLTLVTCYPFYFVGPAPRRFIVRAVLTGKEQQQQNKS